MDYEQDKGMDGWRQGDTLDLAITDLTSSGDGLGRWQERVVFVPDTVPGDEVRVRLVQAKPTFGTGAGEAVDEALAGSGAGGLHCGG
jgi:predicted RNA-binding protein with TRAM domain